MERDEHHPYNHSYLFKDTTLDRLVSNTEKKSLSQASAQLKSKKINLHGKDYATIASSNVLKGFYVVTTEPVFSSDNKYAFIDLLFFYKTRVRQDLNETYFATMCIVYERQPAGAWKKIRLRNHLIL